MMIMIEWFDGWTRLVQVIWFDLVRTILWITASLRLLWFHCIPLCCLDCSFMLI